MCSYKCVVISIDHYRNISFSAYIEYAFFNCTGKFAENVLRISPHFMLICFSPFGLAFEAFVHLYAAVKNVLFSTQSNKKSVNLGTLPVFDVGTKHLVKNIPICLSGNMKEFIWKTYGKVKNFNGNVKDFKKKEKKYMEK